MIISYIGKGQDKCDMCSVTTNEKYLAQPHLPDLANWSEMILCKKCARREIGTKAKKKWEKMHGNN